jgi:hypothetical protein
MWNMFETYQHKEMMYSIKVTRRQSSQGPNTSTVTEEPQTKQSMHVQVHQNVYTLCINKEGGTRYRSA